MTQAQSESGPRGLTEGAILAGIVAMLALATRYLPLIGIVTVYLCPLPLALLVIRRGLRIAILAAIVATLVGTMLAGPIVGFSILISFAPMGIIIGIGAHKGWQAARIVLLGTLASAVSTAASFMGFTGQGVQTLEGMRRQMVEAINQSIQMAAGLYTRFGLSKEQIDAVTTQYQAFIQILPYILPAMLLAGAATAAWLNYEVGRRVLRRLGYELAALPPIRAWRFPHWTPWLFALGYGLAVVGHASQVKPLENLGTGLLISMSFAFMLQGIVAAWMILGNFDLRPVERTIGIILAVMFSTTLPIINVVFLFLGMIDSAWKVRERWGRPRSELSEVQR
ncbi:MAG: YybS family protein [Armatimonadota bacterium]|nr:YybS family protein [Armatimonadota bacterium]